MQLDMHFYGVYAMARAAGMKPATARVVAHASQFVDDALEGGHIVVPGQSSALLPVVTSHKPTDFQNALPGDQWMVWVPFHFLPGNDPNGQTFMERMTCRKDSPPARQVLQRALDYKTEPFGPHLAGIVAHVYADTFSHYGFCGLCSELNKVRNDSIKVHVQSKSVEEYLWTKFEAFKVKFAGAVVEKTLPLGHGPVATFPDRPYLDWEYKYEWKPGTRVKRKNSEDFLQACEGLYAFFGEFVKDNPTHGNPVSPVAWSSIADRIRVLIESEAQVDDRIDLWRRSIGQEVLFPATEDDRFIRYSEDLWKLSRIHCACAEAGSAEYSDPCLYIRAARMHQSYVLNELLPMVGILVP